MPDPRWHLVRDRDSFATGYVRSHNALYLVRDAIAHKRIWQNFHRAYETFLAEHAAYEARLAERA